VEEGTSIRIRDIDGNRSTVNINPGQLIIFRGDVLHNGWAYKKKANRRLYFKLIPFFVSLHDYDFDTVGTKFQCPQCKMIMKRSKYQNHRKYYCLSVPEATRIERKKRSNIKQKDYRDKEKSKKQRKNVFIIPCLFSVADPRLSFLDTPSDDLLIPKLVPS